MHSPVGDFFGGHGGAVARHRASKDDAASYSIAASLATASAATQAGTVAGGGTRKHARTAKPFFAIHLSLIVSTAIASLPHRPHSSSSL